MVLLFCLAFADLSILETERHLVDFDVLEVPPIIRVNSSGEIWVLAYWEGWVKKFGSNMNILLDIPPQNNIPGGTFGIIDVLDLEDGRAWLVLHTSIKTLEIDTKTGKLQNTHLMGALRTLRWGEHILLGVGKYPEIEGAQDVIKVDDQGRYLDSWPIDTYTMLAKSTGMRELVAIQDNRIFRTTGMVPELEILTPGKGQKNWKISTPLNFVAHPTKKFNLNNRFDKNKVREFYGSFTKIGSIFPIGKYGIAICWMKSEQPFLLDIFDYRTGKRYMRTKEVTGLLFGIVGNKLWIYEDNNHFETGQPLENEEVAIHIWNISMDIFDDKARP